MWAMGHRGNWSLYCVRNPYLSSKKPLTNFLIATRISGVKPQHHLARNALPSTQPLAAVSRGQRLGHGQAENIQLNPMPTL
jgi:hypothetical protein